MDRKKDDLSENLMKTKRSKFLEFLINLFERSINDDISGLGAQLAYHLLLAAIPLIFVFFRGVTIFFPEADRIFYRFLSFLPFGANQIAEDIIEVIVSQSSQKTIYASLFASLYAASKGIRSLVKSINRSFGLKENRNYFKLLYKSIFYTIFLILFAVFVLVFRFINSIYLRDLLNNTVYKLESFELIVDLFRILLADVFPYIVITLFLTFFYKTAPATKRNKKVNFSEAIVGGVFVGFSSMLITEIYTFFMNNISNWNIIYGSLASIMAFLVWFLIENYIIILGGEIVASYIEIYKARKLEQEDRKRRD